MAANKIFFEITDICNQRCTHCCKTWRKYSGHTMSTAMLDKIISLPKELLTISGGEPGAAEESVAYILNNETAKIQINTNLTMWSKESLSLFSKKNVMLSVSVVSMVRSSYEKITGTKLFDKLIENLKQISRQSKITMIINNENFNDIETSLNSLIVMGFSNFVIQPAIPNGIGNGKELIDGIKKVRELYSKHRNVKITLMSYYIHSDVPVNHLCDAGDGRLVILSNGDVVPCACMEPIVLGNVMNDPWNKIQDAGEQYLMSFHGEERYLCKGFLSEFGSGLHNKHNDYPLMESLTPVAMIPQITGNLKYVLSHIGYHKGARYLDLGANAGMLYEMMPSDIKYTGVDINRQNNPHIVQGDIRSFMEQVIPGEYDYIILCGALKFLNTKKECLALIEKILLAQPKKVICLQKHYGILKEGVTFSDLIPVQQNYSIEIIDDSKVSYTTNTTINAKGILFTRRDQHAGT